MKYPLDATLMAIKSCTKLIKAKIMALDFVFSFYYFSSLFRLIGMVVKAMLKFMIAIEIFSQASHKFKHCLVSRLRPPCL